jgi:hypothetical protein
VFKAKTFLKALSVTLAVTAVFSEASADVTAKTMEISGIRYRSEMQNRTENLGTINKKKIDYKAAIDYLHSRSWSELHGRRAAVPVSDHRCTNSLEISLKGAACIPLTMYHLVRETGACRLPTPNETNPGACFVVEKTAAGKVEGYFLGSVAYGQGLTRVYRAEITKASTVQLVKQISNLEKGQTVVFSQRDFALPSEKVAEVEQVVIAPAETIDVGAEKAAAKSRVKTAILNGTSIDRADLIQAITIETETERSQAEKEASGIRREMKEVGLLDAGSGYATCYVGGKVELPWVFVLRADGILDRVSKQSKVGIFCYQNGLLKIRLNALYKLKENSIGLRLPGTKSIEGAFGIGVIDGVIDLVTTKQEDGTLIASRKQACIVGVDAGWIFAAGASFLCLPDGKRQKPTLGASFRLSLSAGATVSLFSIKELGLDPDDF